MAVKGAGVNLVFLDDNFDAIKEAIGYVFVTEAYKTYRVYFNVYTIFSLSLDSRVGDMNTIR